MGFLSVVLEGVKDDDAVKTYDDMMTNKLKSVLDTVTKNIGSGRDGLAASVAEVKAWLEGYGNKLDEKINEITLPISRLEQQINSMKTEISQLQGQNYDEENKGKLSTWVHGLSGLTEKSQEALNALNNIDKHLNNVLYPHINSIHQAAHTFRENAISDVSDLKAVCSNVNEQLRNLTANVTSYADTKGEKCITDLKEVFTKQIKTPIENIKIRLNNVNVQLDDWIMKAQLLVNVATGKVQSILKLVDEKSTNGGKSEKRKSIETAASNLKQKAETLLEVAKVAKKQVIETVKFALLKIKSMDGALKRDLYGVKTAIEDKVKEVKTKIAALYDTFDPDADTLRVGDDDKTIEAVIRDIHVTVAGIKGESEGTGLAAVKHKVDKYAEAFRENRFKTNIVPKWLDDILYNNGLIKRYLLLYSDVSNQKYFIRDYRNGGSQAISDNIKSTLKTEIESKLEREISTAQSAFPTTDGGVQENVNAVKIGITKFATELENKLKTPVGKNPGIENLAQEIRTQIEGQVVDGVKKSGIPGYSETELQISVEYTLIALYSKASQAAKELESFALYAKNSPVNLGINLDSALAATIALDTNLNTAIGVNSGGDSNPDKNLAAHVDQAINRVTQTLGMQLPTDSAKRKTHVTLGKDTWFKNYISQVDQDAILSTKLDDLKGHLPQAIKDIEIKVNGVEHLGRVVNTVIPSATIHDDNVFYKNTFDILFQQVNNNLKSFCDAVRDLVNNDAGKNQTGGTPHSKRGVQDLLTDLQTIISANESDNKRTYGLSKYLREIHTEVGSIMGATDRLNVEKPQTLNDIISATNKFHNQTIRENLNECISDINDRVKEEVTDKIKNLKNAALTQFANRKTAELKALKSLVSTQISAIETIINTDSASGLKGLLSRMRGENQYALDKIKQNSHTVTDLANIFRNYFYFLLWFIEGQLTPSPSSQKVAGLQSRTYALLSHLHANKRTFTFDADFRSRLHDLTSALSTFDPATFANPHHPQLLDALKAGMRGLVGEMEKAYVNRYDSQKIEWNVMKDKQATEEITDDAKRCAKVFMSCLPMLLNDLSKVKEKCQRGEEWYKLKINLNAKNRLGPFLKSCGYGVASDVPLQDGELQNSSKMKGEHIHKTVADIKPISPDEHVPQCRSPKKTHNFDMIDYIICLCDHLHQYYTVNHYATFTSTKHPSSIYDMLQWLTGLPHSPVYNALSHDGFSGLFEKKDEDENEGTLIGDILLKTDDDDKLPAYPEDITATNMRGILTLVCHHAEETLISLLGHGHSGGIYACDFNTNSAKLTYPGDPSKCLDLLFEVIGGVYNQLFFLFKQCSYSTKLGGWYDCWYGQGVGGSAWNCNTLQCPGQRGEQKADQMHNQKCNQSCDQSAECGLKSPLQSFLEDGLPGFLPHPYSKSNCKPTCSAPGHFGKVCITPMGFNDISGMASRRQQGRHIMDVLREFCGSEHAPLSRLCGLLTCLLTRPPQTLGDMFAFYYNFLNGCCDGNSKRMKHRELPYAAAVKSANFDSDGNSLDVTSMFKSVYHKFTPKSTHPTGDLFSLVSCDESRSDKTYCGRYLQPCGQHIWTVFSKEHAGNYLSWIVYLTETFYDLLKMLYDDCNNKCGQEHSNCNRTSCAVDCKTKLSSESKTPIPDKYHDPKCGTIVTCKSTLPTFCRYGFVFDNPHSLSGEYGDDKKRTCKDFCRALNRVLSDYKKENDVLAKLKFETIPTFLWNIRSKFFWTTVALWSLSLFYLICVMVGRLDVLHIRSHLRIPSSHKITAQSLLAAAQVGRLAKISYLQP